ncbi:MAG TPA: TlpA disulfide reductase family protein [Candidatus Eisenbacteria bacterium]|nr:TlpA disulfide reductase family protein [Candidatus Eisenbacteria bacterium]
MHRPSPRHRGLLLPAFIGSLLSLLALSPVPGGAQTPATADAFSYPADWKLRGFDGKLIQLRQWKGRIVYLTKWSTRCGPCVSDIPPIEALQDSLAPQGVVFLLVSFEQTGPLRRFADETRLRVPVYRAAEPEPELLRAKTTPATFVIDKLGTVVWMGEGPRGWSGNRDMIPYLRSLVTSPASVPNQTQN